MDEDDEMGNGLELDLERRATDRLLNDLRTNGFRDARQKYMEDESLMQAGFDTAYSLLVRLGFSIGQVRANLSTCHDSALLASVNHRLDAIETFAFDSRVEWIESNRSIESISRVVNEITLLLGELNAAFKTTKPTVVSLGSIFAQIDARLVGSKCRNGHEDGDADDEQESDRKQVDNLLNSFNKIF